MDFLDQVQKGLSIKKVGVQEFAESDEFCGKPIYPRQLLLLKLLFLEEITGKEEDVLDYWIAGGRNGGEIRISPNIRERITYLRENGYEHFREVVLVGGRRSSKGFCTGLSMAKVLYDTLQLQDPGRHYGIDPDKNIYFSCVAGSESQAKEFQYADFVGTVESCKAFEPHISKSLETEFSVATSEDIRKIREAKARAAKPGRDIAKLRGKALAANAGTLRGSATMALALDEVAHMIPGESKASADEVYKAATPALDQFGKAGMIFVNSSPYSKVGLFYDRHITALREFHPGYEPGEILQSKFKNEPIVNGTPLNFTLQYPSWALFEGYQADRRFKKAITVSADWNKDDKDEEGNDLWSEEDKAAITIARNEEAQNPETYKVERRAQFAEVTNAYINPEMVDRMFRGVPNGYDSIGRIKTLPIKTNWGQGVTNLFKYRAHLDPSGTTAGFGFAIGHTEFFKDQDDNPVEHVVFDIIKRWNPKDFPGETIQWQIVMDEVMSYIELFRPEEVTFDQFQSTEPIQRLQYACREKGMANINIRLETATIEHNWFRAETFKTAINHNLIHAPCDTEDNELCANEIKFLQQKNTGGRYPRVDKQDFGPVTTKDMADCVMEVTRSLIGNQIANIQRERAAQAVMAPGAAGGYRIGGNQQPNIADLHPSLAGYYAGQKRIGEQRDFGYSSNPSVRGATGNGRRGISRGGGRRGRGY